MDIERLLRKAKDAKFSDFLSVFPMLVGLIVSPLFKNKYGKVWAICERKDEAQDNGYHFYKFMTKMHPEQSCLYAINKRSKDYQKVKDLGAIIQYGSIKHWITYFTCRYLISSQDYTPNGYISILLERTGLFRPDRVFLQHGITINKPEYLIPQMRRYRFFITATPQETKFVSEEIGHGNEVTKLCGFSRFDVLHENKPIKGRIFIMPTWRKWLRFKSEEHEDAKADIISSEYMEMWRRLLSDTRLQALKEKYDLDIVFYPHPNMKGLVDPRIMVGSGIRIVEDEGIQEIMMSSQLLITDYSSVFFDMVYMKKPVIFYQFDEEKFRKYHYAQGWFDYNNTCFGIVCKEPEDIICEVERQIKSNFKVSSKFIEEHMKTFPIYDNKNSERIFQLLKNTI